jgi:hypothetical protein
MGSKSRLRGVGGVKDRPRAHDRLGPAEQVLDLEQIAIAQDRLQQRGLCVGKMPSKRASSASLRVDLE